MIDRAYNIVIKLGRSHRLSLVRLHENRSLFPDEIMWIKKQIINRLSEVCSCILLEPFLHQKSFEVDMLGFGVSLHASPSDFNTAVTTAWLQRNTW